MAYRVQVGEEILEFPDGMSQEEMQAALEQRYGAPEPQAPEQEAVEPQPGIMETLGDVKPYDVAEPVGRGIDKVQDFLGKIFAPQPTANDMTTVEGEPRFNPKTQSFTPTTKVVPKSSIPAPVLPEEQRATLRETVSAYADMLRYSPESFSAAFENLQEGATINPENMEARHKMDAITQELMKQPGGEKVIMPGVTVGNVREAIPSVGFSGITMGAGAAGAAPGLINPYAGWAGAGAASGVAAHRQASGQFMYEVYNNFVEKNGREPTQEEIAALENEVGDLAFKYGLWEAGPESIGNLLGFGILTAPVKGALMKYAITRWPAKFAGLTAEEIAQETITQMGQQPLDIQAGLRKGEPFDMASLEDWNKARQEVTGPTMALMPIIGTGGAAVSAGISEAGRTAKGEGAPFTTKRAVSNEIERVFASGEADQMVPEVAASMANRATQEELGTPVKEELRTPVPPAADTDERQPDEAVHKPPVSAETQKFVDQALQAAGYRTMDEVPQNVRQSILADAVDMYEQSLVNTVESNTAFELRNLQLEEQRKSGKKTTTEAQKSRTTVKPVYSVGQSMSIELNQAKAELTGEEMAPTAASVTITSIPADNEAIAVFDADIEPLGIKAGDRVKINTSTGQLMTGFGTGAYASARTGRITRATAPMDTTGKTQFSRKKPWEMSADEWLEGYDKDTGQNEDSLDIDEAYANAYDYIDSGSMELDEAAKYVARRTGLPEEDILEDLKFDYGDDWTKDMAKQFNRDFDYDTDETDDWVDQATRDYYKDVYSDQNLWDGTYEKRADIKKETYDYGNWNDYRGGGYFVKRGAPAWALDGHLADNAEGEITDGGAQALMPDIMAALRGDAITDPNMASPMNVPEQNAIARVLRKMVDEGFPRAVIRSITSYGHQRERQYIAVSGAYAGLDHSVRYADYVLRDMVNNRTSQPHQKALRFLMSHELSHAIEADRNEHTLSMDSPLFELGMDAISYTEETRSYRSFDYKARKYTTKEYTVRTPSVDLKKVGPLMRELIEAYNGDSEIASVLSYPFSSLASLANLKAGKKGEKGWKAGTQSSEINRIRAEAFAQLGAISFTYPELAKEHLPLGYAFIQEVKKYANHTDRSARRRALRVPFQLQGAGGSRTRVWSEAAGDTVEGRGEGRADYQSSRKRLYRYENDPRSERLLGQRKQALEEKDNRGNKPYVREGFTDKSGEVISTAPIKVYALYGTTDETTAGHGEGMLHAIYDVHEQGSRVFAWQTEQHALDAIQHVLNSYDQATTKEANDWAAWDKERWSSYRKLITVEDPQGLADIVLVLGYRHQPRLGELRAPMKVISVYRDFNRGKLYMARRGGPGKVSRANKAAAVQRLVDRAAAMTKNKQFDFKVIDNPHNPDFPQRLYREMLTQYSQGDTEVFTIRGLHTEAYGRPQMFIFSDNITDNPDLFELDVVTTILHEGLGGHFTLRQYFGSGSQEFLDFMDSTYRLYSKTPQMRALMEDYGLSPHRVEDRRLAAEEFLAEMAEEPGDMDADLASTWDRLVHILKKMLRTFFRKMGMKVAAVENISSADVRAIMSKARRAVHQKGYSAEYSRNMREVLDSNGTMASRRKLYTSLYEYQEISDEAPYITERQEKLPFYSQLHARAAVDAPMKGTPAKFKKWLETVQKSGEKQLVDIDMALQYIDEDKLNLLQQWLDKGMPEETDNKDALPIPFSINKKEVVKRIDHGKFKGYIQANAPQEMAHSDWKAYLKHAQRAFNGGPVKGEEVEWVGVNNFLDSLPQDAELTRQEFATWINMHKVLLRESYSPASNFKTVFTEYGPQIEQEISEAVPAESDFRFLRTEEYDEYQASEYEEEYYSEREESVVNEAIENVDTSDYIDEEAYQNAIEEEAQRLADEWNDEHRDEIDSGDIEERGWEEFNDEAEDNIDRYDYIDDEAESEATDEAVNEARERLREEAEEYGRDLAMEEADDTYRDDETGWYIQGNSNREIWYVYDQDWNDVFGDHFYSYDDAVENAEAEMLDRGLIGSTTRRSTRTSEDVMHGMPRWKDYAVSTDNYRELKFILPVDMMRDSSETFRYTTHFDDSNIVVYVRLADIVWTVGEERYKTLLIDELQSDWFQIGDLTAYGKEAAQAEESKWAEKLAKVEAKWAKYQEDNAQDAGEDPTKAAVNKLWKADIINELTKIERMIVDAGVRTFVPGNGGHNYWIDGDGDIRLGVPWGMRKEDGSDTETSVKSDMSYINATALRDNMASEEYNYLVQHPKVRALIAAFSTDQTLIDWANWRYKAFREDLVGEPIRQVGTIDNPWADEIAMYKQKIRNAKDYVPEVPLHQVYTAMVMKRMAQLAVDEGYEAIAVAPGEVHSGRWGSDIYAWTNKQGKPLEIRQAVEEIRAAETNIDAINKDISQAKIYYRSELNDVKKWFAEFAEPVLRTGKRKPRYTAQELEIRAEKLEQRKQRAIAENYYERFGKEKTENWINDVSPKQKYYDPVEEWYNPELPEVITEAERTRILRAYKTKLKRARRAYHDRIKDYRKALRDLKNRIEAAKRTVSGYRGDTLPEGQYSFVAALHAKNVIGSEGANRLRQKEYWQPSEERKQEMLDKMVDAGDRMFNVDLNTNEGFKKIYEALTEAFSYSQHYGNQGDLRHHTASAFMPTLLKQMKENPSGGMIFRRGAGLSGWYDRKLLSKGEGIRSLSKDVVVGNYGGTARHMEMAGIVIDDEFKKKWGISQTQFSRRGRPRSDDKRKILAKVGKEGTALQRFVKKFEKPADAYRHARDWFIQKTLDSGLPFKRMVEQLGETPADKDPYTAWRLLSGDGPIIEDWLGVNKGTEGTVPFDPRDRINKLWGKSLREILEPVMQSTEVFKDFQEYIIARRAQELMRVGKENLFTEDDIRYGLSLQNPMFDRVAQEIYRYNDSLIKYAVDGGFLSEEVAVKFRRYANYIPFFREQEYEGDVGGKRGGVFKRLKGGKQNLRDPLQNLIDNTASIIHAVNRNAAMLKALHFAESRPDGKRWMQRVRMPQNVVQLSTQRIIDQLEKQGITVDPSVADDMSYMQTFFQNKPIGDEKNRIIILKEEGKPVAVKVHDPAIWDALHAVAPMELGLLIDALSIPAETIKTGIVMDPGFMGANLARDTLSAFIQAAKGLTIWPVFSSVSGMKNVATGNEIHKLYRAMGSGFSDIWHGDSAEANHSIQRLAKIGKFRPGTVLNPATYWRALRKLGTITETGTRLKTFEKLYKLDPNDPANALFAALEAREISVDFGLHGVSKTLRALERITPFLNPAKQGLYKMGRTLGDQPLTSMLRGSPIMLMTFYLWLLNRDEDWYKDLEDWEKNHYWHADVGIRSKENDIIPIRIPKPFEYGALFGSFPEALYQFLYDEKGMEALERVGSTIEDVFLLRGYPTALSLPTELYFNKSLFTDRPIVPGYLEGIDPRYQYGPFTTMGARKAGEWTGFSPMKIEHATRGIFGTLGMYTLMALDDPMTKLYGEAKKPSRHWWQMPGLRRFFSDPLRPNGKAMTEFYDTLNQYRMEQKTWEFLDYSEEYLETLDDMQSFTVGLEENLSKLMSSIRKTSREVRDMKDMPQSEKRAIIDENTRQLRYISREWKAAREGVKENASQ